MTDKMRWRDFPTLLGGEHQIPAPCVCFSAALD
jgi:hypothetical protein